MVQHDERIQEWQQREQAALQMGGAKRVARQHAKGRLTARERIALLLKGALDARDKVGLKMNLPRNQLQKFPTHLSSTSS